MHAVHQISGLVAQSQIVPTVIQRRPGRKSQIRQASVGGSITLLAKDHVVARRKYIAGEGLGRTRIPEFPVSEVKWRATAVVQFDIFHRWQIRYGRIKIEEDLIDNDRPPIRFARNEECSGVGGGVSGAILDACCGQGINGSGIDRSRKDQGHAHISCATHKCIRRRTQTVVRGIISQSSSRNWIQSLIKTGRHGIRSGNGNGHQMRRICIWNRRKHRVDSTWGSAIRINGSSPIGHCIASIAWIDQLDRPATSRFVGIVVPSVQVFDTVHEAAITVA